MEQTFRVGDRVECVDGYDGYELGPHDGWTGTVRDVTNAESPVVTWDGHGVRGEFADTCYVDRLRLIEAAPSPLEDRIAALEARLAVLEGPGEEVKEEVPQYTFGQPVEVRVYGAWKKGVITTPKLIGDTYWVVYLEADGIDASSDDFFHLKDIRPRTT